MHPIPRYFTEVWDIQNTFLLMLFHIKSSTSTLIPQYLQSLRWQRCEVNIDYVERGSENVCHLLSISLSSKGKRSCAGYPTLPIYLHFGLRDTAADVVSKPAAHNMGLLILVTKPRRPWSEWKTFGGRTHLLTAHLVFATHSMIAKVPI